ncbi:uncharacterized protein LOC9313776 [Arabidopsis lyrata subsp. lyrata]|uniref:uncharacterized protein LOC9313776 n=1 Tax=Arabidopsis lyrata subsp. lyrata TaxID=81972 RepID=UPI000A29DE65|nr:uncharacterized protein LOC9313776 [Arabidopsis lyrata subsp. lyrata]|eukprot:XP_020882613.1 uncharacterized protein LOC9313776 [Arabidopsis lyrata subsp. lyrata]
MYITLIWILFENPIMKGKGIEKDNCFVWLVKAPFRFLIMARDAYIRSITSCSRAGILTGGGSSGFGQRSGNFQICDPPSTVLPRSFTLTSTAHVQELAMRQSLSLDHRRNYRCVVVMGRIDEEISCDDDEFQEEDSFLDYGKCEIFTKKNRKTIGMTKKLSLFFFSSNTIYIKKSESLR